MIREIVAQTGCKIDINDDGKVLWLRSQVQGCCAKVFSAVGVALPPLLTLEPKGSRLENRAAGEPP